MWYKSFCVWYLKSLDVWRDFASSSRIFDWLFSSADLANASIFEWVYSDSS